MAARVIPSNCAARGTVSSSGSSLKTVLSNLIHFLQVGICHVFFGALAGCSGGAAASVPSGMAIVMVRDRSSSHWPHHAMVGGKERGGG